MMRILLFAVTLLWAPAAFAQEIQDWQGNETADSSFFVNIAEAPALFCSPVGGEYRVGALRGGAPLAEDGGSFATADACDDRLDEIVEAGRDFLDALGRPLPNRTGAAIVQDNHFDLTSVGVRFIVPVGSVVTIFCREASILNTLSTAEIAVVHRSGDAQAFDGFDSFGACRTALVNHISLVGNPRTITR